MTAGDVEVIRGNINSHLAVSYDGTDDELQINAAAAGLQVAAATSGTISFWLLPDNITGTYGLFASGAAAAAAATNLLIQQVAGKIRIFGRIQATAGFDIITTNAVLTANEWNHITITQNGTRPTIYINGVAVAMTDTVSTDLTVWWSVLVDLDEGRIGCRTLNGAEDQFLLGVMGPMKIWNVDLYADEVFREFQAKSTQSQETGRQAIIAAALHNYWAWDGLLTDQGSGADTAVIVAHAYLSGHSSQWSRAVEQRGYTHANDNMNTFRDGSDYVTIVLQGA